MHYARFQAALNRTEANGVSRRASLEASAARGNALAIAELTAPDLPETLVYLWEWVMEIRQGVEAGLNGVATMTWTTLDAWCRRTRREPDPEEVGALFALDRTLREGARPEQAAVADEDAPRERIAAWPTRAEGV